MGLLVGASPQISVSPALSRNRIIPIIINMTNHRTEVGTCMLDALLGLPAAEAQTPPPTLAHAALYVLQRHSV